MTDPSEAALSVNTEPTPDGKLYAVKIELGPDIGFFLDPRQAVSYCRAVLKVIGRADYDAAVWHQMVDKLHVGPAEAAQFLTMMRGERPPLDPKPTAPLRFEPGVSAFTGRPFISLYAPRLGDSQLDVGPLLDHVRHVLQAISVADLDSGYYRLLIGNMGLDENRARNVVADIANFREDH